MAKQLLSCTVNGEAVEVLVQPYVNLLDALRENLGLTGPKEGCGTGDCGACTVHVDGKVVASCLMLAMQARGRKVRTIEGLAAADTTLHPLQEAFVRHGVPQCGFCIPGRADGGDRAARGEPAALRGGDPLRHRRQSLPLHRLHRDGGRDQRGGGYPRLAGERSMSTMKTTRDVKGVGISIPRPDGPEKVTGRVQYVADIQPKGLLHAKLLRSPHAHAKIVSIDTSAAKALPGVRAVITAKDIPHLKKKAPTRAHAVLAIDRVVFMGQPVAAVAADEPSIAEEALDLIKVEYQVLAASIDPLKAMLPGAPPVADAGTEADTSEALAHSAVAIAKSDTPAKAVNISQQARLQRGDPAKGFAESDHVLEKTYRVPMVHQGYLEPHAVLAEWDRNGLLTLWASTQGSFNTRSEVADVLGIPENSIRVIPVECGGGFGGKIRALCEPITAVLAQVTKRPVRYVMTRREELQAGMPAPQVIIKLKTGVKRDGTLMALDAETVIDSGALLRRGARGERGLPRQHVQVAVVRHPRLRGADPQAERGRLSRAGGARRPSSRSSRRWSRSPATLDLDSVEFRDAPPDPGRRSDGERPALAEQRRQAGARAHRRAPALEEPQAVGHRAARTASAAASAWRSAAGSAGSSPPARPSA